MLKVLRNWLLRYTSLLMFWTFDLREQVCIFGMKVEIYAMAPFSSVLVLFDFLLVFALLCPLSGITFIDTSLQNLQIFICLHHVEIWLGNLSNYFQRCTLVTRTWPWMMVNEHRLQLSQQHGFTKEAMRKNHSSMILCVPLYNLYLCTIKNSMKHLFPQTIVAFVSYMCGR